MAQAIANYSRLIIVWIASPWLCGYFVALALALVRLLLAAHALGFRLVDLPFAGTYWVANRAAVLTVLAAVGISAVALAVFISRAIVPGM